MVARPAATLRNPPEVGLVPEGPSAPRRVYDPPTVAARPRPAVSGTFMADEPTPPGASTSVPRRHDERTSSSGYEDVERTLRTLMARYQAGDADAFEDFYLRTRPTVHRYHRAFTANPEHASDLTQDTYLQLHRTRRSYNPALPVKPWLLAIARHVRLMAARTLRRRLSRETALEECPPEIAAVIDSAADRAILGQALAQLPDHYREPIVLHHLVGLSFREIAGIVGASEGGTRVRAARGMAMLRQRLGRR